MSEATAPDPSPVDAVEAAVAAVYHSKAAADLSIGRRYCEAIAGDVLTALHRSGWRIVRTDEPDTFDPPPDYVWTRDSDDPKDWDRSGVFYSDEDRPEGCIPLVRVVAEWAPEAQ